MKVLLNALVVAFLATACATTDSKSTHDRRLYGEWNCVTAIIDGQSLPEATVAKLRLTITETRYITEKGSETLFDSTYRVNCSSTPRKIFMVGNEGALTGKEANGIYEVAGDTLRICYALPGDPAPMKFESAPGSKAQLVSWRRVKRDRVR